MRTKVGLAFGMITVGLAVAVYAAEYNFYEQADRKDCASIITERGQSDCAAVQRRKDELSSVPIECNVDKQERTIAKYKEAKERLDRGQVADADKEKLKEAVRILKDTLDTAKNAARKGTSDAQACVTGRENVQKWFADTGIPLTERTRDDALRQRKDLLDKLADAPKKQADASRSATPSPATRARRVTTTAPRRRCATSRRPSSSSTSRPVSAVRGDSHTPAAALPPVVTLSSRLYAPPVRTTASPPRPSTPQARARAPSGIIQIANSSERIEMHASV
jgi:hypothetical protein